MTERCPTCGAAGWREMDSAPKDGSYILVFSVDVDPQISIASWNRDLNVWWGEHDTGYLYLINFPPTHWMPFPDPPEHSDA